MGVKRIIFCDRCKTEVDTQRELIRLDRYRAGTDIKLLARKVELCVGCIEAFNNFVNDYPSKKSAE